jgi:hypothetical protein
MQWKHTLTAIARLLAVAIVLGFGFSLSAQAPSPQELDQLLAPIALYPDALLAQITTASTNPQEILDVDNWLQQNSGLTGSALTDAAERQGFDAAFIALVNFPDVLGVMAENIDDYAAIGQAFSADQAAVSASIQRLRAQAYAAGSLYTNTQQQVEVQQAAGQTVYVIQPANPQVVYVPVYNPTVVYVRPATTVAVVTFGPPVPIGVLVVSTRPWGWYGWGWQWASRRCYYNHTVWVGWGNPYRPPVLWYQPRPVLYTTRPGYGGNWHYRPPNYRPPAPGYRPPNRPPWGPNNRPGYNPPGNQPGGGRPPVQQPKPGRPTQPIAKPGSPRPPTATRPGTYPPPQTKPTQPTTRPGTSRPPGNGANRPPGNGTGTQPKPAQPKPAQPSRPQPQTRPAPSNQPAGARPAVQPRPAPPNGTQGQRKPPPS